MQTTDEIATVLREERLRLQHLFDHAPGFVYFTREPAHVIEQANHAFQELIGNRSVIGKPLGDACPDLNGQEFFELHDKVYRTGKPYVARSKAVHLKKYPEVPPVECYIDLVLQPIVDAAGTVVGICGQGNDVTENRRVEEALQDSVARQAFQLELADRLRSLTSPEDIVGTASAMLGRHLKVARVMYVETDDAAGTFFVRRDWTSPGVPSIAGVVRPLDDFGVEVVATLRAGRPLVVHDVETDQRTAPHMDAYRQLGIGANLAVSLVKDGRLIAVLSVHHAGPRHWTQGDIELTHELAERTWAAAESARANAQLRDERDQSQYIFDSMNEGFVLIDQDWKLTQVNAVAAQISRRPREELLGQIQWKAVPELAGTEVEALYRRVKTTRLAETIEHRHTFPSGEEAWIEIRAYPSLKGGLAIFFRDITDRKEVEQELREASRRKDEFLAMLAHELRNPLAPIRAAAELMEVARLDETRLKQTSQVISRQVGHMTELIDDLLDVSRVTRGLVTLNKTQQDLKSIVANALEQVRPIMETERHHLGIELPPEPVYVMGDQKRLVQTLTNLLNNAAKYTPHGGHIHLELEAHEDRALLHVRDNGIGIAPELQVHVFDLFSQAQRTSDRSQGGLGLGLALVKSLVALHGGTVKCFSEGLGKGSCFTVCLPRLMAENGMIERRHSNRDLHQTSNKLRILLVDDNVDAAAMLKLLLEASGHEVFVEHEPRRALERARIEVPNVCILDIGLPGMDGNELARRLRTRPEMANAVLIAVTGYGYEHDRATALKAGFDHHLVKPVNWDNLRTLLGKIGRS